MRGRSTLGIVLAVAATAVVLGGASTGAGTTAPPRCTAGRLHLAATFFGEAGGQFIQTLTFTNRSRGSCWLGGWPTLHSARVEGRVVRVPTRRVVQGRPGSRPFRRVLLRPAGRGSFDVYGEDFDHRANRPCPTADALAVAAPGSASTLTVRVRLPFCGPYDVAPLIGGRRDRDAWSVVWP